MNYCEQTEKEVLSACLVNNEKLIQLIECEDDIFFINENRNIFTAIKELYNDNIPIDVSVLTNKLKENNIFNESYLISVYQSYTPVSIVVHIERLNYLRKKRKLITYLKDAYTSIKSNDMNYELFIEKIIEVNETGIDTGYTSISDMSKMSLDDIFTQQNFINTGIKSLDDKMFGLRNSNMIIIAGRPGHGKTTLALQMSKNIKSGVLFFSLEMTKDELYLKFLSNAAQVENNRIEHKKMTEDEFHRVLKAHDMYSKYDIKIIDNCFNIIDMKNKIKKMNKRGGLKCVFIDYLQLIKGGQGENQNLRIGHISRTIKLLAMELNIPIVLLSQLSRDNEKQGRDPLLSDLRDSGSLEQDANVVIFTHENDSQCEIIVAKNRKGRTGKIKSIRFIKEYSIFEENEAVFENLSYIHD